MSSRRGEEDEDESIDLEEADEGKISETVLISNYSYTLTKLSCSLFKLRVYRVIV